MTSRPTSGPRRGEATRRTPRRGGPARPASKVEALESRMLLYSSLFTPTSTNLLDAQNGPMANAGSDLVSIYGEYLAYAKTTDATDFGDDSSNSFAGAVIFRGDAVEVDIKGQGDLSAFEASLTTLGMTITADVASIDYVEGMLPIGQLPAVATLPATVGLSPVYTPVTGKQGLAANQADAVLTADKARADFGVDGTGVKIGILSDSVNEFQGGLADSVKTGDLPNNVKVIQDDENGNGPDEGRGMLEVVHDIAPGSPLAFASAVNGDLQFAANIRSLAGPQFGANVIADDVYYRNEPFFQNGVIAQAISDVATQNDVDYFRLAHNFSGNGFESPFRAATAAVANVGTGTFMNFNPGSGAAVTGLPLTVTNQGKDYLEFQFDQPFYTTDGVKSQLNFYILDSSGAVVVSGTSDNVASQTPYQYVPMPAAGSYTVVVQVASGPNPGRIRFQEFGESSTLSISHQFGTAGGISYPSAYGSPKEGIMVGAVPFYGAPPNTNPGVIKNDSYSGTGPENLEYAFNGTKLPTMLTLQKPEVSSVDGSNTSFFGTPPNSGAVPPGITSNNYNLPNFFGTSCATPNLAAVGALMRQLVPGITVDKMRQAMIDSAIALNGTAQGSWDPQGGYGLVQADKALAEVSLTLTPATVPATAINTPTTFRLATLVDGDPSSDPTAYTVSINWGDGTTSAGTLGQISATDSFDVFGTHTYAAGSNYTVTVTVSKDGGATKSVTTTINVAGAPITGTIAPVATDEGTTVSGTIASFVDTNPAATTAADYSAIIKWGDGTTTAGIVTATGAGNAYVVTASHVYGAGNYALTVAISNDQNSSLTLATTATIADLPIAAAPFPVSVVEGILYTGLVATFTDADPRNPPLTNYSATIDWGDGTTGTGRIVQNPTGAGYAVAGSKFFTAGTYAATVVITDVGGSTATVTTPIAVSDAVIAATGRNIVAQEGVLTRQMIASFVDADPVPHPGSFYKVVDNWGDGTTSIGQVIPDGQGGYLVFDQHNYRAGKFAFTSTVSDAAGSTSTAKGTATVSAAAITPSAVGISASSGVTFAGVVAKFTSGDASLPASQFLATIDWGDGSVIAGAVVADAKGGFDVVGATTYPMTGSYPVKVSIYSRGGASASVTSPATVSPAAITATGVPFSASQRSDASGEVAVFRTSNPLQTAANFSASINWGDGTTTVGAVSPLSTGGFAVSGDHTYTLSGSYNLIVTIGSTEGASTAAKATATVAFVAYPLSGTLSASSVTGSASLVTADTAPTFSGSAAAGSKVTVFAQIVGTSGVTAIGSTTTTAAGTWSVQSGLTLPTGEYAIYAQSTDSNGIAGPLVPIVSPTAPLTIDTGSIRVAGLSLDPSRSTFRVTIASGLSGLDQSTITDPSNYSVQYVTSRGAVSSVAVTNVAVASNGPGGEVVSVQFSSGRRAKSGGYVLTIQSSAIRDRAGNALVETYFVPYPSTYNVAGSNYQAEVSTNGRTSGSATQYAPPSSVAGARAHEAFIRSHLRARRTPRLPR